MSARVFMVIDLDRCWGCLACEVACKQELGLGVGPRPMKVEETGARLLDGALHRDFVPTRASTAISRRARRPAPRRLLTARPTGRSRSGRRRVPAAAPVPRPARSGLWRSAKPRGRPLNAPSATRGESTAACPVAPSTAAAGPSTLIPEGELAGFIHGRTHWKNREDRLRVG